MLRTSQTALCTRLSNREKPIHRKTLSLLTSLWTDLATLSKLTKSTDFQNPDKLESIQALLGPKTSTSAQLGSHDIRWPMAETPKGKLTFLAKTQFVLPMAVAPLLVRLYRFLEVFLGLLGSLSIDTDTRLDMAKTAFRAGVGNLFTDLAQNKKLKGVAPNPELQSVMLGLVKSQLAQVRECKSSVLSENNFQLLKMTLVFFSQLKLVCLFEPREVYDALTLLCPRVHLRLYILDRLVGLKRLPKDCIVQLQTLPESSVTQVAAAENFGFYKNLVASRHAQISASEISKLANLVSLAIRRGNEVRFHCLGQLVLSVIKTKFLSGQNDFAIRVLLDPFLANLKASFVFGRKKTKGLSPKVLEKYLEFVCAVTNFLVSKKPSAEPEPEEHPDKIQMEEPTQKENTARAEPTGTDSVPEKPLVKPKRSKPRVSQQTLDRYTQTLREFAQESLFLLLVSKFSKKYLLPVVAENLTALDESFAEALTARINKFLDMDSIRPDCLLQSVFWLLDWLFGHCRLELIVRVFRGFSSAISRLDKEAKKKVFQVCFYILYKTAAVHGVINGTLKTDESPSNCLMAITPESVSDDCTHASTVILTSPGLAELSQQVSESPLKHSLFELLETYPDLMQSFAEEAIPMNTCRFALFPPGLHLNEDFCLEPENVNKVLDSVTGKLFEVHETSHGYWLDQERTFVLRKVAELYPKAHASWLKKFIQKQFKLVKSAMVELSAFKPCPDFTNEKHSRPFFADEDVLVDGKQQIYLVSKLFGETSNAASVSKLRKLGMALHACSLFEWDPAHESTGLLVGLSVSFLGVCHDSLFPVKINLAISLIRSPLAMLFLTEISKLIASVPSKFDFTLEGPQQTVQTRLVSKIVQLNLVALGCALVCSREVTQNASDGKIYQRSLATLTQLLKSNKLNSEHEKLFSNFLLIWARSAEMNLLAKAPEHLKKIKFIRRLPLDRQPLSLAIYETLEREYFGKVMFKTRISLGSPVAGRGLTRFLGYLLRLHLRHFDVSRGNILALFGIVSKFGNVGRKLMTHVLGITKPWIRSVSTDSSRNLEDFKTIIAAFANDSERQLTHAGLRRHLELLSFYVEHAGLPIPYENKLLTLENCKDLNDRVYEQLEIADLLRVSAPESVLPVSPNSPESPKPKPSAFDRLLSTLTQGTLQRGSQVAKFLAHLHRSNQFRAKLIDKAQFLRATLADVDALKTTLDEVIWGLTLSRLKQAEHQPETKWFTCASTFLEAIESARKASANFASSRLLSAWPLRVKFLSHQKHENPKSPSSKLTARVFRLLFDKVLTVLASDDWATQKVPHFRRFFKRSDYSVRKKRVQSGMAGLFGGGSSKDCPRYVFYLNTVLKLAKSFRSSLQSLFAELARVVRQADGTEQSWVYAVGLLMALRLRGLLNYKFDLLVLFGLTRLLGTFSAKNVRLLLALCVSFANKHTVSFSMINCVVSFLEKFVLQSGSAWHPKHIKNFDIPEDAYCDPNALLAHLERSIDVRIDQSKDQQQVSDEPKQRLCRAVSAESVVQNARVLCCGLYSFCVGYAPFALKSRIFKIAREAKIDSENAFVWQMLFGVYATSLPVHLRRIVPRVDELPDLPESHQKLFKKYHCTVRGIKKVRLRAKKLSKPDEPSPALAIENDGQANSGQALEQNVTDQHDTATENEPASEPEIPIEPQAVSDPETIPDSRSAPQNQAEPDAKIVPEDSTPGDDPDQATANVLEFLRGDTNPEDHRPMQPKLAETHVVKPAFNLRETGYKTFKAAISAMDDSGQNLQTLGLLLAPVLMLPNFCYEHLRIVLPKIRSIFEAELAREQSEKSVFPEQFCKMGDTFLPMVMLSEFRTNKRRVCSLLLAEVEQSRSASFKQFLLHLFLAACLREYSASNIDFMVEKIPKFLAGASFLTLQFAFQKFGKLVSLIWETSFERVFHAVIDQIERAVAIEDIADRNAQGRVFALLFCACLASNRKPKPSLLTRIRETLVTLIRSDLEDRTYIDKSRDCLKNYREILRPPVDLDCYQYDKKDVKHLLELSGGLSYFA